MFVVILVVPGCLQIVLKLLGTNNHESHVVLYIILPLSFIENCSAIPRGKTPEFLMFCRYPIVRGNAHQWSIYLLMDLSSEAEFISEWDDLWFLLSIIASKSDFRVSSSIGSRW